MVKGAGPFYIAYTERGDRIRIISAPRTTQDEEENYFRQNEF